MGFNSGFKGLKAVPRLIWLVAGLSPRRPGFDPRSINVKFQVVKVALELNLLTSSGVSE